MNDQNKQSLPSDEGQNTCTACSCPCDMHKEHHHQEHSMTCSKCGIKAKDPKDLDEHGKAHQGGQT